ncbi:MAG: peroxiredoxin family protein [Flavobacteriaceae bacterium]
MELGKAIPEWELESIFGDSVPRVRDLKGSLVLVLFFNLGCPGCKGRALPFANRVAYEKGEQVQVLGIHSRFEGPTYTDAQLRAAKEEYHIRFPYYRDAQSANTFYKYQAGGTPHWILLDCEGLLVYAIFGSDPNNALLRLDYRIQEAL